VCCNSRVSRLVVVVLLVLASGASAAPLAPGKARIDLTVRQPRQLLGEHVLVDFCVVNTGAAAIQIEVGGDYRGSSRSLRFQVVVRDRKGAVMPDPDPNPFNLGGLGYSPAIEPGKRWCQSLPLARYARIEHAGTYTITATHDLGWPAGTAPKGTARLELVMPSAAQAEQVVARMEALPRDPGTSAGQLSIPYADFTTLAYPPYVVPLARRAEQGNVDAIAGLAYNPTSEATRALVTLLGHADASVARAATEALALRLPDPALTGQLGPRNPFEDGRAALRSYLGRAWLPELADDVRTAARRRLASADAADQSAGAFLLEAVGVAADMTAVIAALDVAIARTRTVTPEPGIYPAPRGAIMELVRAARILIGRGYSATATARPGELAAWLIALDIGARPAGWEATLAAAMRHSIAYVRELAMDHAPTPLPTVLAVSVATNLAHRDVDVRVAAARLAQRAQLLSLGPDVVKAMKQTAGIRLNVISNAAYELGARLERARMLVTLLSDEAAFDQALSELAGLLQHHGRSTSGQTTAAMRAAVIPHWRKLVIDRRADIEAGLPISLVGLPPGLVPPTWKLGTSTGSQWP
jgi:hypothetical protein